MDLRNPRSIVEVYPKKIISTEVVTEPYFKVKGREFSRTLYVQRGRPDILVSQVVEPAVTYIHESNLPQQAINSRSQLQDAIYECPPPRRLQEVDSMTDEIWLDVAKVFSG
ncbi:RING-type domain-containing protein [Raphanus sativus]|nr:RING-type domain-containing protein [Raphanus sativus]